MKIRWRFYSTKACDLQTQSTLSPVTVRLSPGDVMLMTTPPYLARSADELLLPKEVVEKDATR